MASTEEIKPPPQDAFSSAPLPLATDSQSPSAAPISDKPDILSTPAPTNAPSHTPAEAPALPEKITAPSLMTEVNPAVGDSLETPSTNGVSAAISGDIKQTLASAQEMPEDAAQPGAEPTPVTEAISSTPATDAADAFAPLPTETVPPAIVAPTSDVRDEVLPVAPKLESIAPIAESKLVEPTVPSEPEVSAPVQDTPAPAQTASKPVEVAPVTTQAATEPVQPASEEPKDITMEDVPEVRDSGAIAQSDELLDSRPALEAPQESAATDAQASPAALPPSVPTEPVAPPPQSATSLTPSSIPATTEIQTTQPAPSPLPSSAAPAPSAAMTQQQPPSTEPPVAVSDPPEIAPQPEVLATTVPEVDAAAAPEQIQTSIDDHEMTDAPATTKLSRERDDEDEEAAPSAKRPKTDDTEVQPQVNNEAVTATTEVASTTNGTAPAETAEPAPLTYPRVPSGLKDKKKFDSSPITPTQRKSVQNVLRASKKTKAAKWFLAPVDPVALNIPHYTNYITEPMDLSSIEGKLRGEKYGSVDDFMDDVYRIVDNCISFNGPTHDASRAACDLQRYIEDGMLRVPQEGSAAPMAAPKQLPKRTTSIAAPPAAQVKIAPPRRESARATSSGNQQSPTATATSPQTYALQPDGMPLIRRESMNADGRPKREIHRPPPRDAIYSKPRKKKFAIELKFCDDLVNELFKPKHWFYANPFLQPVDPIALNLPNYHSVIKKPMDFQTIKSDLEKGNIETAKQFHSACKLVFENCYKFNPTDNPVYEAGKTLEAVFDELWAGKEKYMAEHAPPSDPQSAANSDSEGDDAEEEDEDQPNQEDDMKRLATIQKKIADLTNEATAIMLKMNSKPAPKATSKTKSGKSGAGASGSKSNRKSNSDSKKSQSKTKKPARPKGLTFDQKREISDSIQVLDNNSMNRVVQIVRNGVPELQNVNDDEIELDIDQIPDQVLRDLLKYLHSIRGNPELDQIRTRNAAASQNQSRDDEYEPAARAKTSGGSKRKNKPMSKQQQEASIQAIQSQLEMFARPGSSDGRSGDAGKQNESSSDESQSESEEE